MSDRNTVRRALYDAIDWQNSLADAQRNDPEQFKQCVDLVRRYRSVLKRRYGHERTPMESSFDGCTSVTIAEISARTATPEKADD